MAPRRSATRVTAFGGCDAVVHVVDVLNGKKQKEIEAGAYIAVSGALVDQRLYVGHYENAFICVDLKEGRIAWTYKDRAFPYSPSPAVTADRVIVVDVTSGCTASSAPTGTRLGVRHARPAGGRLPGRCGRPDSYGFRRWPHLHGLPSPTAGTLELRIGQPVQSSPAVVEAASSSDPTTAACIVLDPAGPASPAYELNHHRPRRQGFRSAAPEGKRPPAIISWRTTPVRLLEPEFLPEFEAATDRPPDRADTPTLYAHPLLPETLPLLLLPRMHRQER